MARQKTTSQRKRGSRSNPEGQEITASENWHEVFAVTLVGAGILYLLALVSFHPEDLRQFGRLGSGNSLETRNFVGPIGALVAGVTVSLLGVAAFLVPAVVMSLGVGLILGWPTRSWTTQAGLAGLLLSAACLVDAQSWFFAEWAERHGIAGGRGGLVGAFLGDRILAGALGGMGAGVVLCLVYLLSLMVLARFQPVSSLRSRFGRKAASREDQAAEPAGRLEEAGSHRTREPAARIPQAEEREDLPVGRSDQGISRETRVAESGTKRTKTAKPERSRREGKPAGTAERVNPASPPSREIRPREPVVVDASSVPFPGLEREAAWQEARRIEPIDRLRSYRFPPQKLLAHPDPGRNHAVDPDELRRRQATIVETLRNFRVYVEPGEITRGPTVTRYELYPERGLSVRKIAALEADIALATRAERINILAPIPGKDTVGVEIANRNRVVVGLRELLQAPAFADPDIRIPLALGKDVAGQPLIADLASMPHLLIAGATGSGKSVCINSIVVSFLYRFRPEELRLIMVDPKVVEMQVYGKLPHLAVPVVTETKKVLQALRWCLNETERRYRLFAESGVRKLEEYNALARSRPAGPGGRGQGELFEVGDYFGPGGVEPPAAAEGTERTADEVLPYIVLIIDELADLMQVAAADVETTICRLCQKARAAGIHLIVATQSPRADVVTGLIKANIPARIAFQVASGTDSRVILDKTGAERLAGKGDLLFQPPDSPIVVRAQGAYLSDSEVEQLVDHCASQAAPEYEEEIESILAEEDGGSGGLQISEADEELYGRALALIGEAKKASTSFLQRRLRIGYTRAARLMDLLEERGVVGPAEGGKPREILVADWVEGE